MFGTADVRDCVSLDDVVEEMDLGPNGGLLYAMEYLAENMDWLREEVGEYEDDYLLIDCPGTQSYNSISPHSSRWIVVSNTK